MDFEKIEYKKAGEVLYSYEHDSGLKAFVIPRRGYLKKYAAFATNYGSIDSEFIIPGQEDVTRVPDGIAHFLEHKLFEQKDGNVMEKFSRLGSSPNAYTSFNKTVYLFSCTDRFDENFSLLLDYVQNPYITQESVENEKGIIGQEIMMYQDNPDWKVHFNLLKALYEKHPVRIDIAGTIDSISRIDRDTLYKCYNTFYHPSNMIILAVGDVDPESVFEMVEGSIPHSKPQPPVSRIYPEETGAVHTDYIEERLAVSIPMFQMGYKGGFYGEKGIELLMYETAVKLVLELLIGRSSDLYEQLYSEGLINSSFGADASVEKQYAFSVLGGESPDPVQVRERFCHVLETAKKNGLDRAACERLIRSFRGRFMRQFNSVERISHSFISVYFKGVSMFDYLDVYDKITFEYVNEVLHEHFKPESLAMSVIRPV
ncbi:MAG TPA: pitrilysin family protein [Clostridiales bacterium]|nr:pitrilysin family protein [Clostridiales bacterium]